MLFPLALTPFEYYFWCDDSHEYPTSFPIELTFSGRLVQDTFTAALRSTIARHPLLTALIDDTGNWPKWIAAPHTEPDLNWRPDDVPIEHPDGDRIDLRRVPGLRAWVRTGQERTRVYLQFHHACCDGLAVQLFLEDLLVSYSLGIGAGTEFTKLRELDPEQLRNRAVPRRLAVTCTQPMLARLLKFWIMLCQWFRILRCQPAVVASSHNQPFVSIGSPRIFDFSTRALDADQIRRLKQVAAANGVTANDVLLRDLFRLLKKWNARHGDRSNRWLRINMPANERDATDRTMPAANRLSFTFLTRRAHQCGGRYRLLHGIHTETESIKRHRLGQSFLDGLALASNIRGVVPWVLRRHRSFATICLSNVGRVMMRTPLPRQQKRVVCGDAILERIAGAPLVRPLTRAAITVVAYANEMTINLRTDQRYLTGVQRDEFLAEYMGLLGRTLELGR